MISLARGLAVHEGCVLLVASRYPNHADPLWNLPGGRQQPRELLEETVLREVLEETGLRVEVGELAYVSESYDGAMHFLNVTFNVMLRQGHDDCGRNDARSDHVVAVEWVPIDELAERIAVGVVREPLLGYLRGTLRGRYAGYHDAGITIEWPADSQ